MSEETKVPVESSETVEAEAPPIEDPFSTLDDQQKSEVVAESVREIDTQDILVCGKCHQVFHFIEGLTEHKASESCKEDGELKETLKEETKPQIWAFTLWKNTKFKDFKEEEKPPTSWSIYQHWKDVDAKIKDAWIKAGENIQALFDIVNQYEKIKIAAAKEAEMEAENERAALQEKDPLSLDDNISGKTTVLKPVQIINNKKAKNTRKAIRTGSDPKVEHLVEKIISKRYNPRKKTFEYLIKWENFDAEKNTWEPIAALQNCKNMITEFEKNLQIQKEQKRLEKMLAKKNQKKEELLQLTMEGRPQRTSKQKALDQVKQWCGNMEADENSGKRVFSDDSDDDDSFEKRMKYEEYSSDSENDTPMVTIKRIPKSQNGVEKKAKIESITLPNNILIPDAKGVVRINQKQIPSLSSGVYVMSKTAGIIKLDTKTSKLATSGGQTVLKVAPKIGQTSIKVIKKDLANGTTMITKTANILRTKPVIRNYSSRVYMQKRTNAQNAVKKQLSVVPPVESSKEEAKEDDESDGIEEMDFPTEIALPQPDSPPSEFTLCPLTGKVLGKDGKAIDEPECKEDEVPSTSDGTAALDNLVNMAAADILDELQPKKEVEEPMEVDQSQPIIKKDPETVLSEESTASIDLPPVTSSVNTKIQQPTKMSGSDSILSTALTNANIVVKRQTPTPATRIINKQVVNRTIVHRQSTPQAIITRITPGTSPIQRSRVMAPKPKDPAVIRKRTIISNTGGVASANRSIVRKVAEPKVYSPASSMQSQQITSLVATPTTSNVVINMPSLMEPEAPATKTEEPEMTLINSEPVAQKVEEPPQVSTQQSPQSAVSLNNIALTESDAPLLITGEDGTIYQVAGQNEEGQTILITQGEDGEQQCLLVAPENAGLINQALMKPAETVEPEAEPMQIQQAVTEAAPETDESNDDSQVVAQIVSANPPSPGGTRKVVLMLPDGNLMMTEVTAEQYAALELDK